MRHQSLDRIGGDICHHMSAGQAAMLRAKQQLLALLLERVRDQTAYTRKQVLASWTLLAEHAKIPISHWVPVAELAIGEVKKIVDIAEQK